MELNPSTFLDTERTKNINGVYKSKVCRKSTKKPSPWTSKPPKSNKRNTTTGNFCFSK